MYYKKIKRKTNYQKPDLSPKKIKIRPQRSIRQSYWPLTISKGDALKPGPGYFKKGLGKKKQGG